MILNMFCVQNFKISLIQSGGGKSGVMVSMTTLHVSAAVVQSDDNVYACVR